MLRATWYNNIVQTIFNSPMVRLNRVIPADHATVLLKLEFFNSLSSIKDRVGRAMIEAAEHARILHKDTHIIEPTSGNTGIALAFVAAAKGYRLTAEDRLRAEIIERLMCDFRVDAATIAARHGFDAMKLIEGNARLSALAADGAIDVRGGTVTVRQGHRFIIRAVAAAFDAYIDQSARTHSKAA